MDQFISKNELKWIPYDKFENIECLDKGEFGTIYKAKYEDYEVTLKSFNYLNNSDESLSKFLSEWTIIEGSEEIIKIYGFTKDPNTLIYMLIMEYTNKGNLRECLTEITKDWKQKLFILYKIIKGLNEIHEIHDLIHYNFHDGNILCNKFNEYEEDIYGIFISDYLGLYQHAKSFLNENNIYGVMPFIAPEILKGQPYTQASDVYSFSMVMWEITSGISPFNDKAHDLQLALNICRGKRPEIIENTPQCYVDLMKKCWDEDPLERPSSSDIFNIIGKWIIHSSDRIKDINEELKSNIIELINAPIENNSFIVKSHPQAYYKSHLLDFTSKELNETLEESELKQKNDDAVKKFHKLEKIAEIYYQSFQTELKEIQLAYQNIQMEKNNLQYQLAQSEASIQQLKSQQDQMEEENLKLENELVDLQQRNSKFEQDNQNLQLKSAMQIKEFAEKENILQNQIINLQNEKQNLAGNLTEQLEQNKLTNQQVQIQIIQLEQGKIDLQEKLTQTEVNIQKSKSHKESLIEQKEQLENRLNQSQVNYEQIEQERIKLQNMTKDLSQDQNLKVKLEKEIAQLEQKLINKKQIKMQLTQALQIKEDKINELEQSLINLDQKRIMQLKEKEKELNKVKGELVNKSTSGENTKEIHEEKEAKQKEIVELQQELSRISTSYDANRKKQVLNQVNNFLKTKENFLTLREKAIKRLQNCFNHLESSINKDTSKLTDKYTEEFQSILVKYNGGLLELNKNYYSLKKIVQENKELEVSPITENILKLNSFNLDKYKIFKFATNSQEGTRIQLNSNMMAEDINSLKKNLDELKLELKQEKEELKNLAAN